MQSTEEGDHEENERAELCPVDQGITGRISCNGYIAYPFEKMTMSSFPSISILARWNSMKEGVRVFSGTYYCGRMRITLGILYYPEGIVSDCEL